MDFSLFNKFFDQVYVLTISKATDRHEKIKQELRGLNFKFLYGQDKNDLNIPQLIKENVYDEKKAIKNERRSKTLPPGMLACSIGHKMIYEDAIQNNYQKILVFEDDVVINKSNWRYLSEIFADLPSDWELLYFGYTKNEPETRNILKQKFYHLLKFFNGIKYTHTIIRNLYPKKISDRIYTSGFHDCAHAYGLTLEGAKKLVAYQTPISFFPDNLLSFAATTELVKAYITHPKLIDQESITGASTYSYIHS